MKWFIFSVVGAAILFVLYKFRKKVASLLGYKEVTSTPTTTTNTTGIAQGNPVSGDSKIIPTYGVITTAPLDGISQNSPTISGVGGSGSFTLGQVTITPDQYQEPLDQSRPDGPVSGGLYAN